LTPPPYISKVTFHRKLNKKGYSYGRQTPHAIGMYMRGDEEEGLGNVAKESDLPNDFGRESAETLRQLCLPKIRSKPNLAGNS